MDHSSIMSACFLAFLDPLTYININSTVNQQNLPFSDPTHLFANVVHEWSLLAYKILKNSKNNALLACEGSKHRMKLI